MKPDGTEKIFVPDPKVLKEWTGKIRKRKFLFGYQTDDGQRKLIEAIKKSTKVKIPFEPTDDGLLDRVNQATANYANPPIT